MEFKVTLKDVIVFIVLAAVLAYCIVQIQALKTEVKYSQNFTAIVNQLNTNTNDIKAIAQAVQAGQQRGAPAKDTK